MLSNVIKMQNAISKKFTSINHYNFTFNSEFLTMFEKIKEISRLNDYSELSKISEVYKQHSFKIIEIENLKKAQLMNNFELISEIAKDQSFLSTTFSETQEKFKLLETTYSDIADLYQEDDIKLEESEESQQILDHSNNPPKAIDWKYYITLIIAILTLYYTYLGYSGSSADSERLKRIDDNLQIIVDSIANDANLSSTIKQEKR